MNFIFISPNYPSGHWKYVSALRNIGVNVLCIGDAGDETFSAVLRGSMTEYYRVGDLHDYDSVYRACAYFIHKYGRIDCVESLNPYWRDLEAELRFDFQIKGLNKEKIRIFLELDKSFKCAVGAGVPVVPHEVFTSMVGAKRFAARYGYPVYARPINNKKQPGMYLSGVTQLELFLKDKPKNDYMLCSVPEGEYISCDGVANSENKAVICLFSEFVEPPEKVASENGLLAFWSMKNDEKLYKANSLLLEAFELGSGFFHFNFVRLASSVEGLGKKGECVLVSAEFNPPAEYITDAMCSAVGKNVYDVWARLKLGEPTEGDMEINGAVGCAARRFDRSYKNSHEKILRRLGAKLQTHVRTTGAGSEVTGDYIYIFKCVSKAEAKSYIRYIQEDFASPKILQKTEISKAVKKNDAALKKAMKVTDKG